MTCNPRVPRHAARVVIALAVGPEVLAGSTRLKAGTATKLTLNTLTTAAFARLGKVYGNRMVDLRPRSAKLRARALPAGRGDRQRETAATPPVCSRGGWQRQARDRDGAPSRGSERCAHGCCATTSGSLRRLFDE